MRRANGIKALLGPLGEFPSCEATNYGEGDGEDNYLVIGVHSLVERDRCVDSRNDRREQGSDLVNAGRRKHEPKKCSNKGSHDDCYHAADHKEEDTDDK